MLLMGTIQLDKDLDAVYKYWLHWALTHSLQWSFLPVILENY